MAFNKDDEEKHDKESFQKFMESPATKLMISMIPPADNEVLKTLLSEAFQAGVGRGMVQVLMMALGTGLPTTKPQKAGPPLGVKLNPDAS